MKERKEGRKPSWGDGSEGDMCFLYSMEPEFRSSAPIKRQTRSQGSVIPPLLQLDMNQRQESSQKPLGQYPGIGSHVEETLPHRRRKMRTAIHVVL